MGDKTQRTVFRSTLKVLLKKAKYLSITHYSFTFAVLPL